MAKGCGMEVEHLVYLNVRDDLAAIRHHLDPSNNDVQHAIIPLSPQHATESTSAFFSHHKTKDRVPILAHSWSESKRIHDDDEFMVLLEIQYCCHEDVADMVILVEAGMISGSGMNSLGLAVTGNPLFSNVDHIPGFGGNARYFPMTCLERYLLEWYVNFTFFLPIYRRHMLPRHLLGSRTAPANPRAPC
jgi:isopenicillin-N N-acyltransferase-like protein